MYQTGLKNFDAIATRNANTKAKDHLKSMNLMLVLKLKGKSSIILT